MKERTISAIILLLIMIGSIVISSKLFGILMLIFSIMGYREFFDIRYDKKISNNFHCISRPCVLC